MARIRTALFAALALVALAGCDARSVSVEIDPSKTSYVRDVRTGICMGVVGRAAGNSLTDQAASFSIFAVECTQQVLALVPASQGGTRGLAPRR